MPLNTHALRHECVAILHPDKICPHTVWIVIKACVYERCTRYNYGQWEYDEEAQLRMRVLIVRTVVTVDSDQQSRIRTRIAHCRTVLRVKLVHSATVSNELCSA